MLVLLYLKNSPLKTLLSQNNKSIYFVQCFEKGDYQDVIIKKSFS